MGSTHRLLPPLLLPRALARRLDAWAVAALPYEACGLLVGRRAADGTRVDEVVLLANAADGRREDVFELDPAEHLAVEEAAARAGLEVVGVWHSHPDSSARPSAADRARAWAGWSYPIVGFAASTRRELRSWRIDGDEAVEEPVAEAAATPVRLDLPARFTAAPEPRLAPPPSAAVALATAAHPRPSGAGAPR